MKIGAGKAVTLWVYTKIHRRGTYNARHYESKEGRGKISVLRHGIHTLFTFSFITSAIRPYTTLILYLPHCLIRLLQQTVSMPLASAGLAAPAIYSDGRHQTCTAACTSVSLDSTSESHFPRRIQGPPRSILRSVSARLIIPPYSSLAQNQQLQLQNLQSAINLPAEREFAAETTNGNHTVIATA